MEQFFENILKYSLNLAVDSVYKGIQTELNQDQNIKKVRTTITETLLANYSLNYDYVFMELLKDDIFLPIKNCINSYYLMQI